MRASRGGSLIIASAISEALLWSPVLARASIRSSELSLVFGSLASSSRMSRHSR